MGQGSSIETLDLGISAYFPLLSSLMMYANSLVNQGGSDEGFCNGHVLKSILGYSYTTPYSRKLPFAHCREV